MLPSCPHLKIGKLENYSNEADEVCTRFHPFAALQTDLFQVLAGTFTIGPSFLATNPAHLLHPKAWLA